MITKFIDKWCCRNQYSLTKNWDCNHSIHAIHAQFRKGEPIENLAHGFHCQFDSIWFGFFQFLENQIHTDSDIAIIACMHEINADKAKLHANIIHLYAVWRPQNTWHRLLFEFKEEW